MEGSVQRSAFCELRQAAGYKTVAALAGEIDRPRRTIASWDTGRYLPKWPEVQKIADAFRKKGFAAEALHLYITLRGQSIDGPLSCGCRGRIRGATSLSVEIPCKNCGKVRTYEQGHSKHRELCKRCAAKLRRPINPVTYTCIGYNNRGETRWKCSKTEDTDKLRVRNYQKKEELGVQKQKTHAWIDESTKQYFCARCATAARKIEEFKEEGEVAFGTDEHRFLKTIKETQFRPGRNSLEKIFCKRLTPEEFEARRVAALREAQAKDESKHNHIRGRLAHEFAGKTVKPEKPLPKNNYGRCCFCRDTVIVRAPRPALFHGDCDLKWRCTPEGKLYLSLSGRRGRRKQRHQRMGAKPQRPSHRGNPVDLKLYHAWAVQLLWGRKTLLKIAKAHYPRLSKRLLQQKESFVAKKIKLFFKLFPADLRLLQEQFRLQIQLLIDDYRKYRAKRSANTIQFDIS